MLDPLLDFPSVLGNPLLTPAAAHVIVVEPVSSARMMIMDVLRSFGFRLLKGAASLKEAWHYLETERVDWLLTPLQLEQSLHALKLLKLTTQEPALSRLAISLFVDPVRESSYLLPAFELGLLSYHPNTYAREDMEDTLGQLLRLLRREEGEVPFVAAAYIRPLLRETALSPAVAALERELLARRPHAPLQMLALAEAEGRKGELRKARERMTEIVRLDPSLQARCRELLSHLEEEQRRHLTEGASRYPKRAFASIVLIDDSQPRLTALQGALGRRLDSLPAQAFRDGQTALLWIAQHPGVDLVVLGSNLSGMQASVVVQRLRQTLGSQAMIVLASAGGVAGERALWREMGVDEILERAPESEGYAARIAQFIEQRHKESSRGAEEIRVRRLLAARRTTEAAERLALFVADKRVPETLRLELEAEVESQRENFAQALSLTTRALKLSGGHRTGLLQTTGHCLAQLGQVASAVACWERARELSPFHIGRLVGLSELYAELGHKDKAEQARGVVETLDPGHPELQELKIRRAVTGQGEGEGEGEGEEDAAGDGLRRLEENTDPARVARLVKQLQSQGLRLLKKGDLTEAAALYQRLLYILPKCAVSEGEDLTLPILFSMARVYAALGQWPEAIETLGLIEIPANTDGLRKKDELLRLIESAREHGSKRLILSDEDLAEMSARRAPLSRNGGDPVPVDATSSPLSPSPLEADRESLSWGERLTRTRARKGDLGCYLLFQCPDSVVGVTRVSLEPLPGFQKRT